MIFNAEGSSGLCIFTQPLFGFAHFDSFYQDSSVIIDDQMVQFVYTIRIFMANIFHKRPH